MVEEEEIDVGVIIGVVSGKGLEVESLGLEVCESVDSEVSIWVFVKSVGWEVAGEGWSVGGVGWWVCRESLEFGLVSGDRDSVTIVAWGCCMTGAMVRNRPSTVWRICCTLPGLISQGLKSS